MLSYRERRAWETARQRAAKHAPDVAKRLMQAYETIRDTLDEQELTKVIDAGKLPDLLIHVSTAPTVWRAQVEKEKHRTAALKEWAVSEAAWGALEMGQTIARILRGVLPVIGATVATGFRGAAQNELPKALPRMPTTQEQATNQWAKALTDVAPQWKPMLSGVSPTVRQAVVSAFAFDVQKELARGPAPPTPTAVEAQNPQQEKIALMAAKLPGGEVYTLPIGEGIHADVLTHTMDKGKPPAFVEAPPAKSHISPIYGFTTTTGRFVDREEAWSIALRARQLLPEYQEHPVTFDKKPYLLSEAIDRDTVAEYLTPAGRKAREAELEAEARLEQLQAEDRRRREAEGQRQRDRLKYGDLATRATFESLVGREVTIAKPAVWVGNQMFEADKYEPWHSGAIDKAREAGAIGEDEEVPEENQGFSTSEGEYVDRTEAYKIAKAAGQLFPKAIRDTEAWAKKQHQAPFLGADMLKDLGKGGIYDTTAGQNLASRATFAPASTGERIAAPAIIAQGDFYVGAKSHYDAMVAAPHGTEKRMAYDRLNPETTGFITTTGRWVSREEAFEIAKAAGQIERTYAGYREEPEAAPILLGEDIEEYPPYAQQLQALEAARKLKANQPILSAVTKTEQARAKYGDLASYATFTPLQPGPERIVALAVKEAKTGIVTVGRPDEIHATTAARAGMQEYAEIGAGNVPKEEEEYTSGFVTDRGRFVTRREATPIATNANQLIGVTGASLGSEDVDFPRLAEADRRLIERQANADLTREGRLVYDLRRRELLGAAYFQPTRAPRGGEEALAEFALKIGGNVYTSVSHDAAIRVAERAGQTVTPDDLMNPDLFGFTTTTGRFVSRNEAIVVADHAGQLNESAVGRYLDLREEGHRPYLIAEDLTPEARIAMGRDLPNAATFRAGGGGEAIAGSAVKVGGKWYTGHYHYDAYLQAEKAGASRAALDKATEGYYTTEGRFVTREQAFVVANQADQIKPGWAGYAAAEREEGRRPSLLNEMFSPRPMRGKPVPGGGFQPVTPGDVPTTLTLNRAAFEAAGYPAGVPTGYAGLPEQPPTLTLSFDYTSPSIQQAVDELNTRVMQDLSGQLNDMVRAAASDAFARGASSQELARVIKTMVGLSPRQMRAIQNYESYLRGEGDGPTAAALQRELRDRRFDARIRRARESGVPLTEAEIVRMRDAYARKMVQFNAQTIARTVTNDAQKLGQQLAWQDAIEKGYVNPDEMTKTWVGVMDDRERPTHVMMEGETVPFNETYSNGQMVPGDDEYNCFAPGTVVSGAFVGGLEARYAGPMREIETARGHRLTVTPNHPILTVRGWVAAGALHEGDRVLSDARHLDASRMNADHIDDEQGEAVVEDVFQALAAHGTRTTRRVHRDDFHGDAVHMAAEIDVVGADVELWNEGRVPVGGSNGLDDGTLDVSEVRLVGTPAFGAADRFLRRDASSSARAVSGVDLSRDGSGVLPQLLPFQPLRCGPASNWDTAFGEASKQDDARVPAFVAELLEASAGHIALDQIVEVRDVETSGHVYDLQAVDGWMLAGGVVASNCRCISRIVVGGVEAGYISTNRGQRLDISAALAAREAKRAKVAKAKGGKGKAPEPEPATVRALKAAGYTDEDIERISLEAVPAHAEYAPLTPVSRTVWAEQVENLIERTSGLPVGERLAYGTKLTALDPVARAEAAVVASHLWDKNERALAVNRFTGEIEYDVGGDTKFVMNPVTPFENAPDDSLVHLHSHPKGIATPFSNFDVALLGFPSVHSIRVATEGGVYAFEKSPAFRRAALDRAKQYGVPGKWSAETLRDWDWEGDKTLEQTVLRPLLNGRLFDLIVEESAKEGLTYEDVTHLDMADFMRPEIIAAWERAVRKFADEFHLDYTFKHLPPRPRPRPTYEFEIPHVPPQMATLTPPFSQRFPYAKPSPYANYTSRYSYP